MLRVPDETNPPASFHEVIERLGEVQQFEVAALRGDAVATQGLCDFVTALALVFNDLRDLGIAVNFVNNEKATMTKGVVTRRRGELGGLETHIVRMYASVVGELLRLIDKNAAHTGEVIFTEVLKDLSQNAREGWTTLVAAANDKWTQSVLGNALEIARNKVGFHYDAEEIGRGFRKAFVESVVPGTGLVPMLSSGNRLSRGRFYFADAAAQAQMASRYRGGSFETYINQLQDLIDALQPPLFAVVDSFLRKRAALKTTAVHAEDELA